MEDDIDIRARSLYAESQEGKSGWPWEDVDDLRRNQFRFLARKELQSEKQ